MSRVVVVTAPDYMLDASRKHIFLAGGITGCPDWQADAIKYAQHVADDRDLDGLSLLNPRQPEFDVTDPDAAPAQIEWEYRMLSLADVILFWFPRDQVQPIALFELGRHSHPQVGLPPIAVGAHQEYARRQDIELQLKLAGYQDLSPPKHGEDKDFIRSTLGQTVELAIEWAEVM